MRRVEFLGAPGVGKTTLHGHVRDRRPAAGEWLTDREARGLVVRKLANAAGWRHRFLSASLQVPRLREVVAEHLLAPGCDQALRASPTYQEHRVVWQQVLVAALPPGEVLTAAGPWARRLGELALFEQVLGGRMVLWDESYSKAACGYLTGIRAPLELLDQVFRLGPRPSALVWVLDPEPDEVAQRLVTRLRTRGREGGGRFRFGDRLWTEADLIQYVHERTRYDMEAARILEERGVPVLRVVARSPLQQQAEAVEAFVRGLERNLATAEGITR
jgi:hypothetical protein